MRYKIAKSVRWTGTADGAILLDVRRGKYFSLNTIGVAIWRDIVAGRDVTDILRSLSNKYPHPEHTLARDLSTYLDALLETRVIEIDRTCL
jgi:hypothetical protein